MMQSMMTNKVNFYRQFHLIVKLSTKSLPTIKLDIFKIIHIIVTLNQALLMLGEQTENKNENKIQILKMLKKKIKNNKSKLNKKK